MIVSAEKSDINEILKIVNEAYTIETGTTGVAFKNAPRLQSLSEVEELMNDLYVLKSENNEILGVIAAELSADKRIVCIGPLAVHPNHQVHYFHFIFSKSEY